MWRLSEALLKELDHQEQLMISYKKRVQRGKNCLPSSEPQRSTVLNALKRARDFDKEAEKVRKYLSDLSKGFDSEGNPVEYPPAEVRDPETNELDPLTTPPVPPYAAEIDAQDHAQLFIGRAPNYSMLYEKVSDKFNEMDRQCIQAESESKLAVEKAVEQYRSEHEASMEKFRSKRGQEMFAGKLKQVRDELYTKRSVGMNNILERRRGFLNIKDGLRGGEVKLDEYAAKTAFLIGSSIAGGKDGHKPTRLNPLGVRYAVQNRVLAVRKFLLETIHVIEKEIDAASSGGSGQVENYQIFANSNGKLGSKSVNLRDIEVELFGEHEKGMSDEEARKAAMLEQADLDADGLPTAGITARLTNPEREKVVQEFQLGGYQNMAQTVTALLESAVTEGERLTRTTERRVTENWTLQNGMSLESTL